MEILINQHTVDKADETYADTIFDLSLGILSTDEDFPLG